MVGTSIYNALIWTTQLLMEPTRAIEQARVLATHVDINLDCSWDINQLSRAILRLCDRCWRACCDALTFQRAGPTS